MPAILTVSCHEFYFESVKAATDALALLSKAVPVDEAFADGLYSYSPAKHLPQVSLKVVQPDQLRRRAKVVGDEPPAMQETNLREKAKRLLPGDKALYLPLPGGANE